MKDHRFLLIASIVVAVVTAVFIGCKNDVAGPMWNNPPASSLDGSITGVSPAQALAGVNTITITGNNLSGVLDSTTVTRYSYYTDTLNVKDSILLSNQTFVFNGVYFNNVQATVISASPGMIKVYRPNVVSDNCTITIASNKALVAAKYNNYKITSVSEQYGSFVANVPLSTVTVDSAGNLYVVETASKYLWKVTPNGQSTKIMTSVGGDAVLMLTQVPSDAKIGPDGRFYYLSSAFPNTKEIHMVDFNASTVMDSLWYTFAPVKNVICGDFDANGYFYTGGRKSGIQIIRPNRSKRDDGYYATDTISSMRVFNGYVYVATRKAIYRHSISDTSKIGATEPVLDLTQGIFPSLPIKALSFSANGTKMYIGTDSQYPILVVDVPSAFPIQPNNVEFLYRGILSSYCKQFCFEKYLYMISGNTTPAVNWTVYKIDVGTTGAPYYH
jgi:hypothetical protein